MTGSPDERLRRLLGNASLARVRQRLRRHFERLEPDAVVTHLRLETLDRDAYAALCQLTGQRSRMARSMTLDVVALDARLRAGGLADSLRDALEKLEGPIIAKSSLRRELQARWSAVAAMPVGDERLLAWLRLPAALPLLKRLGRDPDRAARLLAEAHCVLRRLPADGVPRSRLAAETLGDAHALDAGRPAAAVVLATWRHHERNPLDLPRFGAADDDVGIPAVSSMADDDNQPGDGSSGARQPQTASDERLRDVWARAGVLVSELARPALFLNLPPAAHAASQWTPGEPAYLSLRQLLRRPPGWCVAGRCVFVCENPDIVAIAADRLGASGAPLVCTDGMPAAAQRTLLDQLTAAGAQLRYHGDYDRAGIGIANFVLRRWGALPWRFGAADYLTAVAAAPSTRERDLDTATIEATWDPELGPTMQRHGLSIAEEAVVATLLDDLDRED